MKLGIAIAWIMVVVAIGVCIYVSVREFQLVLQAIKNAPI